MRTPKERLALPPERMPEQEEQCQLGCSVTKARKSVEESVAIGGLERFAADWEAAHAAQPTPTVPPPTGKWVAVVGSGPAGLTVAGDLARLGHAVTVFEFFQAPTRILGDEKHWVRGLEVVENALGEPDESGRRRPLPRPGTEHVLEVDTVIVAIGNEPNPLVGRATPGLRRAPRGTRVVDPETQRTSIPGVFSGGDAVLGAATVILALGQGRRAAAAIARYLETGDWTGAPAPWPHAS